MAISTDDRWAGPYATDGLQTVFAFDFAVLSADTVVVYSSVGSDDTQLVYGTDYSVTLNADQDNDPGGTVTLLVYPIPNGPLINITSSTPVEQPAIFTNTGNFYPTVLNDSLDRLTIYIQEIWAKLARVGELPLGDIISRLGRAVLVPLGEVGITLPSRAARANKRLAFDANGDPYAANPEGGTEPTGDYAEYMVPGELKDIGVNLTPLSGGGFPRTLPEELSASFSGGNPDGDYRRLGATDLGECLLIPPTEEQTVFVAPSTPWFTSNYGKPVPRRIVPLDIRTNLFNSPISLPLFRPMETNAWGWLTWQYIGEEPIHTVLKGSMTVALRTGTTAATEAGTVRQMLRLTALNPPHLEDGQNSGVRQLAASIGGIGLAAPFASPFDFSDMAIPFTQGAIDIVDTIQPTPELFAGYDNGAILPFSTDEDLATSDALGPFGPEVRTTKWIDVSDIDFTDNTLLVRATGPSARGYEDSTIRRVQYKDDEGEIHYWTAQSFARSSFAILRLPPEAKSIRIFYSQRGDNVTDMSIKRLNPLASTAFDQTKGLWITRNFNVHRDVVFWPGTIYCLNFYQEVYDGALIRDWGFRYQSGGLSFLFDVGKRRKELATRLYS